MSNTSLHILHLYFCDVDFFFSVWLVILIEPFFGVDSVLSEALLCVGSNDTSVSGSVSPSYGSTSGTGSPGKHEEGCSECLV